MTYPKGSVPRGFAPKQRVPRDGNREGNENHKRWLWQIRDLAVARGWKVAYWWRSDHSPRGFPDMVLAHRVQKRLIFIEAKTGKGRLTPDQKKWRDLLLAINQEWYLMMPENEGLLVMILEGKS
jgi:hypothetical protein